MYIYIYICLQYNHDEIEIAKLFNEYSVNKIRTTKEQSAVSTEYSLSEVEMAIAKYRNHPSINAITEKKWKNLATIPMVSISLRMRPKI